MFSRCTELTELRHHQLLQTMVLGNEVFVWLIEWQKVEWQGRAHFGGVAATLMRQILAQFARAQQAAKRSGRCDTHLPHLPPLSHYIFCLLPISYPLRIHTI